MNRRDLLTKGAAIGAIGATSVLLAAPAVAQSKTRWRLATLYPRGVSYGVAYQNFADTVTKMTDGRLTIDVVYDGEGVNATEVLSATSSGLVEMGAPYMALHAGEVPAGVVELTLPGAPTSTRNLMALFNEGGWIETLRGAYGEHNIHYLAPLFYTSGVYLITKDPINSLSDLKGKVLRSPGAYGKFVRALGAKPVVMAYSEMYPSMATGVIDGAASSNPTDYADINLTEVAKHMYPLPITGAQIAALHVNMDAWKKLPKDLQSIVETAGQWNGIWTANKTAIWERRSFAKLEKGGLIWAQMPSSDDKAKWTAAGSGLAEEYAAANPWSAKLIEQQRAFMTMMGI